MNTLELEQKLLWYLERIAYYEAVIEQYRANDKGYAEDIYREQIAFHEGLIADCREGVTATEAELAALRR